MSFDYVAEEDNWKIFAWQALKTKTATLTSSSQCYIKEITEQNVTLCWAAGGEHVFTSDEVHLMDILDSEIAYCFFDQKYSDTINTGSNYGINTTLAVKIDTAIAYMAGI